MQHSLGHGEAALPHATTAGSSGAGAHDMAGAQQTRAAGGTLTQSHGRTSEEMMDEEIGAAYASFSAC